MIKEICVYRLAHHPMYARNLIEYLNHRAGIPVRSWTSMQAFGYLIQTKKIKLLRMGNVMPQESGVRLPLHGIYLIKPFTSFSMDVMTCTEPGQENITN